MTGAVDGEALRRLYPSLLAKTLSLTKSLPDAEDAVQEALARALERWPRGEQPESAEAWLLTVAANNHRDRLRRTKRESPEEGALERLAQMSPWVRIALGEPDVVRGWKDELLRLLFACCHPALEAGESAALALATVIGLSTQEIAAAFVVQPRSMEQRLTRARKRLRERGDVDGAWPSATEARLDAVLRTIHLLFNEGYWSSHDGPPIRADLCRLAMGLARSLHEVFPDHGEVRGLLALLLLHDARRGGRLDAAGTPVPLPQQDRARWDHEAIRAAPPLLEEPPRGAPRGPFQLEAAISAAHTTAATAETTDWTRIARLYGALEALRPTPAVRVNRCFAVARAEGAAQGLALLDDPTIDTQDYPYVHLVRATLLQELGKLDAAQASFAEALAHARNPHERAQIEDLARSPPGSRPATT